MDRLSFFDRTGVFSGSTVAVVDRETGETRQPGSLCRARRLELHLRRGDMTQGPPIGLAPRGAAYFEADVILDRLVHNANKIELK